MKYIRSKTRYGAADPADGETRQVGKLFFWVGAYMVIAENSWVGLWGPTRLKNVKVAHGM